jgi:hypothetical protein
MAEDALGSIFSSGYFFSNTEKSGYCYSKSKKNIELEGSVCQANDDSWSKKSPFLGIVAIG